jgi:hypothetical protein
MDRRVLRLLPAFALALLSADARAEQCVVIGSDGVETAPQPPSEPKVVRVASAFCGVLYFDFGPGDNSEVQLQQTDGARAMFSARTDSDARFTFTNLPLGKYSAFLPGFNHTAELIEIASLDQQRCDRTLYVKLELSPMKTCDGEPTSHITTSVPAPRK